jgi:hypothetical protein
MTPSQQFRKSFYDCDGKLAISCTECTRGPFGSADPCAAASRKGYCFIGTLKADINRSTLRKLPRIIKHKTGDKKTCFDGTPCKGIEVCAGWNTCQRGRS